jgi:hypothetical protein
MTSELTVSVKDEEKTLKKKFLLYDSYQVDENDPVIKDCIDQVLKNFAGEPDRITVKINMYLS